MTLDGSTVSCNGIAAGLGAGGIDTAGTHTHNNSTVSNNTASDGGGIVNQGAVLILNDTTVSTNKATAGDGGGIVNHSPGVATLQNNSKGTGNEAHAINGMPGIGGGILTEGPPPNPSSAR